MAFPRNGPRFNLHVIDRASRVNLASSLSDGGGARSRSAAYRAQRRSARLGLALACAGASPRSSTLQPRRPAQPALALLYGPVVFLDGGSQDKKIIQLLAGSKLSF